MKTTTSAARSVDEIATIEAMKKRAARQAAKQELAPEVYPTVDCVVLPMGHDKISMGQHIAGLGTVHFEEGETFSAELPAAVTLYERGYINFEGARDAVANTRANRQRQDAADRAELAARDAALASAGGL